MRWVSDISKIADQPTANTQLWLTKPYILSDAIKRICQVFTVKLLSQCFKEAPSDDKIKLSLTGKADPFVREVQLCADGVPLIDGRVTIPHETYYRHINLFEALGDQPIGETILYHHPNVRRDDFEYAFLKEKEGWGRRSLFFIQGDPLLVTECMANPLPAYKAEKD